MDQFFFTKTDSHGQLLLKADARRQPVGGRGKPWAVERAVAWQPSDAAGPFERGYCTDPAGPSAM